MSKSHKIGLALSGGGSRAMAFHLGCMRALHDYGVLERISVLSSVSGGSVIAAMYAYADEPFEDFDARVVETLRRGFVWGIARQTLLSPETLKIIATQSTAGVLALLGMLASGLGNIAVAFGADRKKASDLTRRIQGPLRRGASRTTAFERHLRLSLFGDARVTDVRRPGLDTVINAAELRTGTAFRYGSKECGCWRFGALEGPSPFVSKAVAASAAYPALLPAFDESLPFRQNGAVTNHRVIVTDGGVYDNLGITCLLPGRRKEFSSNVSDVDFIIACDAGAGLPAGVEIPYTWSSRMKATVSTIHRRTHSMSYGLLHRLAETGEIKGFLLPYLGQQDDQLPEKPANFVTRDETYDYPTDFSPMSGRNIDLLSTRGYQLTRIVLSTYHPGL